MHPIIISFVPGFFEQAGRENIVSNKMPKSIALRTKKIDRCFILKSPYQFVNPIPLFNRYKSNIKTINTNAN